MDYRNFSENESLAMLLDRSTRDLGISLQRIFKNNGFDITVEQWMILLLLWKKNGRTQQEIANIIGKDKGTISPQIDGLEKRELIMRMQDQNDKRHNLICLTRKGRDMEEQLVPLGFTNIEVAQYGITEEDLKTCKEVLRRICMNLEEGNAVSQERGIQHIRRARIIRLWESSLVNICHSTYINRKEVVMGRAIRTGLLVLLTIGMTAVSLSAAVTVTEDQSVAIKFSSRHTVTGITTPLPQSPDVTGFLGAAFLSVGDIDNDGIKEIVCTSGIGLDGNALTPNDGAIAIFTWDGSDLDSWTQSIINSTFAFPNETVLRDMDGDTDLDIMVMDNFIIAWISCGKRRYLLAGKPGRRYNQSL